MIPYKFCPYCGSRYEDEHSLAEGLKCSACDQILYPQLKLGAAGLIQQEGKILLLKRSSSPFAGSWNLPAGYVPHFESPMEAVRREVYEECGLEVAPRDLFGAFFFDDDPRGKGVLLVYRCKVVGGEHRLNEESSESDYFAADQMKVPIARAGHDQAILAWQIECGSMEPSNK